VSGLPKGRREGRRKEADTIFFETLFFFGMTVARPDGILIVYFFEDACHAVRGRKAQIKAFVSGFSLLSKSLILTQTIPRVSLSP